MATSTALTRRNCRSDNSSRDSESGDDDDDTTVSEGSSEPVHHGFDVHPDLDEMMKTLDDDKDEYDPNRHWVSCMGRFMYEIWPFQNWFLVQDPPYTGRTLDIPSSFAPTGPWPVLGKLMSLVSVIGVFVWAMLKAEHKTFFLAYLHTWNLVYSTIYFYCSFLNTLAGVAQPFSRVNGSVRLCWFMFIVAAQTGILEAILYWGTECDYATVKYDFLTIMLHGGVTLEVILDGFTVNFIPLRWTHWWGCCLIPNILYYGWTLIHGFFTMLGNPDVPGQNSIYRIIEWRYEWKQSLWDALFTLFGISPGVFLILWMMSLYRWCCCLCFCWRRERRRYLENTGNLEKYREMGVEMEKARLEKEEIARQKEEKRAAEKEARMKEKAETEKSSFWVRKKKKKPDSVEECEETEVEKTAFLGEDELDSLSTDSPAGRKKNPPDLESGRKKE